MIPAVPIEVGTRAGGRTGPVGESRRWTASAHTTWSPVSDGVSMLHILTLLQDAAASGANGRGLGLIGAGLAAGLAVVGAGVGIGRIGGFATQGISPPPGRTARRHDPMVISRAPGGGGAGVVAVVQIFTFG